MPQGTNTAPNYLWKARFKINTPDGGINFTLQLAEKTEAVAKGEVTDIGNRLRALMPSTCEIYACTISRDDRKKDSRIVPNVIGPGLYLQSGVSPAETFYNRYNDCVLCRFEDNDGTGVTMKIGPIPDTVIGNGEVILPITSVPDMTIAVPVLGAQPITFAVEFTNLMHAIGKACHHVVGLNHAPGGLYDYFPFQTAHVKRVGGKRGGLVFTK